MIYFITDGTYTKVGYTSSTFDGRYIKRIKQLQTANPNKLELLGVIANGDIKMEKKIHKKLKDRHVRGEWFDLNGYNLDKVLNAMFNRGYEAYTRQDIIDYENEQLQLMSDIFEETIFKPKREKEERDNMFIERSNSYVPKPAIIVDINDFEKKYCKKR